MSQELLFAKSKAYLHPTSSKKDNVAGFLTLTKPVDATTNKQIVLNFVPESSLSSEQLSAYNKVDLPEESKTFGQKTPKPQTKTVVQPPAFSVGEGFSASLSSIYSIQFRKPSVGWWYGSIIIYSKTQDSFPIVFFHDDESPSTLQKQKLHNQSFDPFGDGNSMYWGGADFLQALSAVIKTERSTVEPSVYLVDPVSADLVNFSPFGEKQAEKPAETLKLPNFNKIIANAKWKVLETVATFGSRAKNQVIDIVDDHVPKVVVDHIINKPEVKKISNDFESAQIYLAKWAAQVKAEAEQSQKTFMLEEAVYARINKELGSDTELLTPEEISKASRRKPVSSVEWQGFFDSSGRLVVAQSEVKSRIFHGGLEKDVRKEAWPFLLNVYPWDSSTKDREYIFQNLQMTYCDFKRRWSDDEAKRETEFWKDQKVRIEKDVHRNDRHLEIFQDPKGSKSSPNPANGENDDEEWDLAQIKNVHLFKMREILLTFNEYNVNLGYVQGMTDLLSPIYVVFQDEVMSFWAFAGFMERMERNFVRDQSGMKQQMLVLNELVQFMLPNLFKHLEKCESTDLFFFFRMLLVWYKREFEWEQVNTLWEVLWTDLYSSQYHLFVALAVLSDNERIMIQNLRRFDEVLKYMNDRSGNMNLHNLLVRAELLFLRFRRMIDIIDREQSREQDARAQVNPDLRKLLSKTMVVQKEVERPEGAGGG